MEEQGSLRDEIRRMNDNMEKLVNNQQTKKWSMPWGSKVSKPQVKRGWANVIYIGENREAKFVKVPIDEGVVKIDEGVHLATTDYTLTYKGKPLYIQPSWSIKPFSPEESYEKAVREHNTEAGYRLLMNKIKKEQIMAKKVGGSTVTWIIVGLVVLGVGYYLLKGGI
jgi:hypothetical protein